MRHSDETADSGVKTKTNAFDASIPRLTRWDQSDAGSISARSTQTRLPRSARSRCSWSTNSVSAVLRR
jgi:hypothetical protein